MMSAVEVKQSLPLAHTKKKIAHARKTILSEGLNKGDGNIHISEFPESFQPVLSVFDYNNDGDISREELMR